MKIEKFSGINNVATAERLGKGELTEASNVDIGLDGEVLMREGFTEDEALGHLNVWQADGFMLATVAGDLVNVATDAVLYAGLTGDRVWYCNLPDGRTAFSNGLINGIVSAAALTKWGVQIPASVGTATDVPGSLHPGSYQWSITYVRTSDGLESGPAYSAPVDIADGGIVLAGLPTLTGHTINVYLTSHNGTAGYYAGNTSNSMFSFTGENTELVKPCWTDMLSPAPVGTISAMWRGRALVAVGNVLYASKPTRVEHFDLRRDFKQFPDDITLVQPVDGGIFVGTESALYFLAGETFDGLVLRERVKGAVILGSGVTVPGKMLLRGDGNAGAGDCMVCIADRVLTAGYQDGSVSALSEGRYQVDEAVTEVAATLRMRDRLPLYIAIPQ